MKMWCKTWYVRTGAQLFSWTLACAIERQPSQFRVWSNLVRAAVGPVQQAVQPPERPGDSRSFLSGKLCCPPS